MTKRREATSSSGSEEDADGARKLLKIEQVASRLSVSVGCMRAWRLRGEGPPAIRIGSALRWDAAEVDSWLDTRRESQMGA